MSAWRRLVAFVGEREDATSLALCRIGVALTILAHVGRFLWTGAAELALTHADYGGLGASHGWLAPLGGATTTHVIALCLLCCAAASFSLVGLFTRPALVILWLSFRALSMLNPSARGAYDALLVDSLVLLILSGSGRALSLDARLFERAREVARWPRILLVMQLGVVYTGSALTKVSSGWVPGGDATALWYILHQPMWARGDVDAVPLWVLPFTQVATTLVWCWELLGLLFVAAVMLRERERPATAIGRALKRALDRLRFREVYLVIGLFMHAGIEITMEVGAFSFATLALYACALRPEEWRRLAALVRERLKGTTRRSDTSSQTSPS
jgi:hypothetical protein